MCTDRFIVDVVIMHVDDLVYRVFALERHKREPCTLHDKPAIQALADISRSALCCHSNETRAPIANPSNSAQLGGTPLPFPQVTSGSVQ